MRTESRSIIGLTALAATLFVAQAGWAQDGSEAKKDAPAAEQGSAPAAGQDKPTGDKAADGKEGASDTSAAAGQKDEKKTEDQPPAAGTTEPAAAEPEHEKECADGTDNDKDGAVDCADADCVSEPACQAPPPAATPAPGAVTAPPANAAPEDAAPVPLNTEQAPAPAADSGQQDDGVTKGTKPFDKTFALEAAMGLAARLGGAVDGNAVDERSGLLVGGELLYSPDRSMSFGLSYLYTQLGQEKEADANMQGASVNVRRRLHTIKIGARMYPYRTDSFRAWAGLGVGVTIEQADASGARIAQQYPVTAEPYHVDMDPNPGLAMAARLGVDYDLSQNTALLGSLNFTEHLLSSDPQSSNVAGLYVNGIGATPQLDFRVGFQYRFDVATESMPVQANVQTSAHR